MLSIGLSGRPDTHAFFGRFWKATSVTQLWNSWNPMIHYVYFLFIRWLRRIAGHRWVYVPGIIMVFVFNGLWHDALIWAMGFSDGYRFTWTVFFLLNALVVLIEKSDIIRLPVPAWLGRTLTFSWIFLAFVIAAELTNP